jgi:hypothetical protein
MLGSFRVWSSDTQEGRIVHEERWWESQHVLFVVPYNPSTIFISNTARRAFCGLQRSAKFTSPIVLMACHRCCFYGVPFKLLHTVCSTMTPKPPVPEIESNIDQHIGAILVTLPYLVMKPARDIVKLRSFIVTISNLWPYK